MLQLARGQRTSCGLKPRAGARFQACAPIAARMAGGGGPDDDAAGEDNDETAGVAARSSGGCGNSGVGRGAGRFISSRVAA
jgi:hypothetical protein